MAREKAKRELSAEERAALRGFKTYLVAECGLAALSVTAYIGDVADFVSFSRDYRGASLADVIEHTRRLAAGGARATTLNRKLSALRVFYRHLVHDGVVKASPLEFAESPKKPTRLPDYLYHPEVEAIIDAAAQAVAALAGAPIRRRVAAARDVAMLALAYACGLRASELTGLKVADVDLDLAVLRVRGKGGRERIVPFGAVAKDFLGKYLALRKETGEGGPYVFGSARRRGPVSRQLLWRTVKKFARAAGVEGVKPHLFRHTFAAHLVQAGADIRTVQELLGHASITTTQIYAHLDTRSLTAFHEKYHPRK